MNRKWMAISTVSVLLGSVGLASASAHATPLPTAGAPSFSQEQGGWDQPPGEFREVQRKGFHDGVEGRARTPRIIAVQAWRIGMNINIRMCRAATAMTTEKPFAAATKQASHT